MLPVDARGEAGGPPVPAALHRAGLLVVAEGAALALLGVGYAVSGLVGSPEDRLATVLLGLMAVLVGGLLVPVGRALAQARGWAVSPTVVVQLFVAVVAVGLFQGGVLRVAVPLLVVAAVELYLLATPESRAVLREGP